jgi:integrase
MVDVRKKTKVDALTCEPDKTMQFHAADSGDSLFVRVIRDSGSKTYVYKYRPPGSTKQKTIVIGDVNMMPGREAIDLAKKYETERTVHGRDPALLVYRPKETCTINEMLDFHLSTLTAKTNQDAAYVLPEVRKALGDRPIGEVTKFVIKGFLEANYEHRSGLGIVVFDHLHSAFNKIMDDLNGFTVPPGFVNPCKGLKKHIAFMKNHRREGYAVAWGPEEWRKIKHGFEVGYAESRIHDIGLLLIELIMLTGARPGEIENLRWDEIETVGIRHDDGTIQEHKVIIKQRHKTWKKTGRPRRIMLFEGGLNVLERAAKLRKAWAYNGPLVFFSCGSQKRFQTYTKASKYIEHLRKHSGIADLKPYNFRSGYINMALDHLGFQWLDAVAENCGHADTATTLEYYRKHRDAKLAVAGQRVDDAFHALWQADLAPAVAA